MSTEASADSAAGTSPDGQADLTQAGTSPRLVYPPVAERRPPSRPVFAVAFAALVLFVAAGLLLLRHNAAPDSGSATDPLTPTMAADAYLIAQVAFGPGLVVSESQHAVFKRPVRSITLTVPKQAALTAGGAFDPRVSNVQILLGDGPPISVDQELHAGDKVTVSLPAPTTRLDVVFVAYNAVVRSKPSSQQRAIALVTPLAMTPNAGTTAELHLNGTKVTNVGCTAPNGTSTSCGSEGPQGWTITLGPRQQDTAVIAQLDLQR